MGGASAVLACVRNAVTHLEWMSTLLVMVRAADLAAGIGLEIETTYTGVDAGPSGRCKHHVTIWGPGSSERVAPKQLSACLCSELCEQAIGCVMAWVVRECAQRWGAK